MVTFESRVLKICESLKNYVFSGNVLGVGCMKKCCKYSLWQCWYIFLNFLCMSLLHDGMYADYMHFWYPERSEEVFRSYATRVVGGSELFCRCRELTLCSLHEKHVLLDAEL